MERERENPRRQVLLIGEDAIPGDSIGGSSSFPF